ncbi:MAG: M20 family metallopeptidase [Planctomycetaceae bacterium]|nr:M20 family metallopeptidase [Planctomycetaceae bacterium]
MLNSPIELLEKLISLPSVNPMGGDVDPAICLEHRVTQFLCDWSRELGIDPILQTVSDQQSNVILLWTNPQRPDAEIVLLDAHQDTVPVAGMTVEPFLPTIENGRMYGRGACDVKGGMAAMLSAFARIVRESPTDGPSVMMSCTVDEEATTTGINRLTESLAAGELPGERPVAAIIAEPTELDIIVTHRGVVRWKIETSGTACHSSTPELGENAIYRMGHVVTRLEAYAESLPTQKPAHPKCGPSTLSVGRIGGGSSVNIVPDSCWIEVDRRLIPGETAEEAQAAVIEELKSLPFEVIHHPPWLTSAPLPDDENGPLAAQLMRCIESVAGDRESIGVAFGTHASRTARIGIPSVVFGPGNIAQAHTKDEWIDIQQLEQAAEVYYQFCKTFKPA